MKFGSQKGMAGLAICPKILLLRIRIRVIINLSSHIARINFNSYRYIIERNFIIKVWNQGDAEGAGESWGYSL